MLVNKNTQVGSVEALWANHSARMLPHAVVSQALQSAAQFSQDDTHLKGLYLKQQLGDFVDVANTVPGYVGVFSTGYPNYAQIDDCSTRLVPEIERFTKSFLPLVDADQARGYGAWICGACQEDTDLPDLKSMCKPCTKVELKPRDIFKALPDLDYWVVVDGDVAGDKSAEPILEMKIKQAGFYTSDQDINYAVDTTNVVMTALQNGEMPNQRLPLDLHLIGKDQLVECIDEVPAALAWGTSIPIRPRSLHVRWTEVDQPYDFTKDFLFSMTETDWRDEEMIGKLQTSRRAAKLFVGDEIVSVVSAMSPKEARQLETEEIQQCLKARVEKW